MEMERNAKTHLIGCGENAAPKGSRKIYRKVNFRNDAAPLDADSYAMCECFSVRIHLRRG